MDMTLLAARNALIGTENAFKIGPHILAVEARGQRVIRCNLGEPDFPLPLHIAAEVKRQIDRDLTHYCDPQGVLPLREAVARKANATKGLDVTPDRVVVFPGAKSPIGFCQQAYCEPGDEVIYPSPGFPIYESFTRYVGAVPVPAHLLEDEGFTLAGATLEPLITSRTKLVFLNFPSNPTGGVATREQLSELAAVIRRKAPADARVYSDEVYEDILFDGARHHSIASEPEMARRTIIVGGASKSFSWTGGRIGWAIFPTVEEAQLFKTLNINYFSCVPPFNQMGAAVGLTSEETVASQRAMVSAFQQRRDEVVKALNDVAGVRCQMPRGAFYVFPNIAGLCERLGVTAAHQALPAAQRERTTPSGMFQMFLLYRYQVATMDRRSFGAIGTDGMHFLRISIATGIDDLREAMKRLAAAALDRNGFRSFLEEGPLVS
jgi:aspartate aminotransferase